jgi:4-amino-4-deoxy-L-arabinose transferase-like glycosyltransferase
MAGGDVSMNRKLRILIVFGLLVYCLALQGMRGLWEPDEGRYSAVAMEMLRQGDWIEPHLHPEQPHWTKPPLTYWAIAASVFFLGRNEFAVRLPSTMAFFLTTCLVFLLGRLFLQRRAWLAPLVYASFLLPAAASNFITTDGLLTLWETAAICSYAYAVWGENRDCASGWMLAMWGAFGLAFLTKGPPGLLPLSAVLGHRLWRSASSGGPRLHWLAGPFVMMTVGLSWFGLVISRKPELTHYFLVHEVYGRIVTGEHSRNSQWYKAFVIYLPVIVLGTLPWTFWLTRYVYRCAADLLHCGRKHLDRIRAQDLFLLLWVLCPLLIFMASSSRLPLYLLPLFVPMSLLAARGLETASFAWSRRRLEFVTVWCVLLVALRMVAGQVPTDKDAAAVARAIGAMKTTPFSEIVFYAADPVLGLDFYLDKEVESVSADTLDDELGEGEDPLWVLPPITAPQFLEAMAARGKVLQPVGRIGERYLLFQQEVRAPRPGLPRA